MNNAQEKRMRILAIEPAGFQGHKNFNSFFLRCLKSTGHVTFLCPTDYLESHLADSIIEIPETILRHNSKIGARWSAIRVLNYIFQNVRLDEYDAIVFLAYETISFSVRWPPNLKVFLFEHNNIENCLGSWIKTFCYNRLPRNAIHLVFQHKIAKYIRDTCNRKVFRIPHPYYRKDVNDSGGCSTTDIPTSSHNQKIIFSPSGSTPSRVQEELMNFASSTNGAFYAICKGTSDKRAAAWEVSPLFKDYEELMRRCYIVFLGAHFSYRVSGVAFEALSYGKPLVMIDSPFAQEMQVDYPHLIYPIKHVNDIKDLVIDHEKAKKDHHRFLYEHSFGAIQTTLTSALSKGSGW